MSVPTPALLTAKAEAERSKTRFMATLGEVQDRLAPATIARNAWDGVRDKSEEVAEQTLVLARGKAEEAIEFSREKPAVAGTIAGVLAAYAIRKPLARGFRRLFRKTPRSDPARLPGTHPDSLGTIAARAGD